ncbi:uncharacterized protein LOC142219611 isoform X2 [Haematobia irritans]|uniref:uncharacterized protein LOC142219611 isoform X2 n=1 Tax=Haematobia irritans TaxID=7368 RepID=UPI003F4FBF00
MQEKLGLLLILFTIGIQCRDYNYDKPLVIFNREDGGPTQYVTTSTRMIIPGSNQQSPQIQTRHHQGYAGVQQQNQGYSQQYGQNLAQGQSAGQFANHQAVQPQQNSIPVGYNYQNPAPSFNDHQRQYQQQGSVYNQAQQQFTTNQQQQNIGDSQSYHHSHQQTAYNQGQGHTQGVLHNQAMQYQPQGSSNSGASVAYNQQQFNAGGAQFNGNSQQQNHSNHIANEQKHQQVLQNARSHLEADAQYAYNPPQTRKGLRDRRLLPYSEVEIDQYPYNK